MKYRKGILSSGISKNDIVNIRTSLSESFSRYLVIKINMDKKYLDILPVDGMFSSGQEGSTPGIVPVMSMPFNLISKIKKDNNSSILFLMNQDNPHIINAIFSGE
jgi:hypothetical protein